jgi:hypothetical protein
MDLYRDPDGRIWDCSVVGRRLVTADVANAYVGKGGKIGDLSGAGRDSIPRIPDTGLQQAVTWGPMPGAVDVTALSAALAGPLAAAVAADLPGSPAGALTQADVEAALRTVLHNA